VLPDGVFTTANITVENGCITVVESGEPFLYQPDLCCGGGGGGGGGEGLQGDPGPPGQNATIMVGTVSTLAPGSPATVTNAGTNTNAILDFGIPAGAPGGGGGGGSGLTLNSGGWSITSGLIQAVPFLWPPVVSITGTVDYTGMSVASTKDPDGIANITISGFAILVNDLENTMDNKDSVLRSDLEDLIADLQAQINAINNCLTSNSISC
jgi:hypothetical protein